MAEGWSDLERRALSRQFAEELWEDRNLTRAVSLPRSRGADGYYLLNGGRSAETKLSTRLSMTEEHWRGMESTGEHNAKASSRC